MYTYEKYQSYRNKKVYMYLTLIFKLMLAVILATLRGTKWKSHKIKGFFLNLGDSM